jgi:hypothetical protein
MPAPPQTSNLDGTWAITLNGQTRFIMISGSALAYLDAQGNVISASTFYTQGSTWHETFQDGRQFSTQFQLSPDGRTLTIVMNNGQTGTYQKVR